MTAEMKVGTLKGCVNSVGSQLHSNDEGQSAIMDQLGTGAHTLLASKIGACLHVTAGISFELDIPDVLQDTPGVWLPDQGCSPPHLCPPSLCSEGTRRRTVSLPSGTPLSGSAPRPLSSLWRSVCRWGSTIRFRIMHQPSRLSASHTASG